MRIKELETPAIVVDLDVLERNLQRMSAYCAEHGLAFRPHTKTHKIPAIAKMQIESGARGVTIAKPGEAEVMAEAGLDDLLIAYPTYGTGKWERIAKLASSRRVTVAVDSEAPAQGLSQAAKAAGATIHLLVEFDAGMKRCGVSSPEEVAALAAKIEKLPGVRFAGVMFYPGHIWNPPDEQAAPLAELSAKVTAVIDHLKEKGFACDVVSGGSTPTAFHSHLVQGLTEIRPGTYVFNDRNTVGAGACEWADCALKVLVTVVSTAVPGRAMIDGGSKTFTSDRWLGGTKSGFGHILEHPDVEFAAMSEEHGHLDLGESGYRPDVGDRLSIIPNHVCACVNLHDQLYFHRNGVVEGSWQVAGRGKVR